MDWSSIYEENGNESGDFDRADSKTVSVRTGILDSLQVYNPYVCYAFTVNYILGVGCLGIPYAFYQSGIILGSLLIMFLSFISYITVLWVAETSHRGMQFRIDSHSRNPFRSPKFMNRRKPYLRTAVGAITCFNSPDKVALQPQQQTILESSEVSSFSNENEKTFLKDFKTDDSLRNLYSTISQLSFETEMGALSGDLSVHGSSRVPHTGRRRSNTTDETELEQDSQELEVTELTSEILGPKGFIFFQFAFVILNYVGLLAYTQVFIASFKSQIWSNAPTYFPTIIFGILVIPLSCFDLAEQIVIQVLMSFLRFFSLGILILFATAAMFTDNSNIQSDNNFKVDGLKSSLKSILSHSSELSPIPLFDISGFGVMFTTAIFR
jgi:hypothetical protein